MSEQQTQHESWKAARARIAAAAIKPPAPPKEHTPTPTHNARIIHLVPPGDIAAEMMDTIIAAVGVATDLPVNQIIAGPPTKDHVAARQLAMALSVRFPQLSLHRVAEHFEVSEGAVQLSVALLDPILARYAISSKAPLIHSMPLLVREWRETLDDLRQRPTLLDIQKAVCRVWGVEVDDLRSQRRTAIAVEPRHVAMAICKKLTLRSLPEIGRAFGGRDHTTVLHAIRKFDPIIRDVSEWIPSTATPYDWALAMHSKKETTTWPRGPVMPISQRALSTVSPQAEEKTLALPQSCG